MLKQILLWSAMLLAGIMSYQANAVTLDGDSLVAYQVDESPSVPNKVENVDGKVIKVDSLVKPIDPGRVPAKSAHILVAIRCSYTDYTDADPHVLS